MCFGYKIPEKKIKISFWIKKSETENNTLQKNLSGRNYCVLEKRVWNVILYALHFFKGIFDFSPVTGCSDMMSEAIANLLLSFPNSS